MTGEIDFDQLRADVGNALCYALARHEKSLVGNWVVLVETTDLDGARGLFCLAPDTAKSWDTKGMLAHALDLESAATVADRLDRDE